MDTAQWPQGIGVVTTPMEGIAVQPAGGPPSLVLEKRAAPQVPPSTRPQKEQALNCPRCNSGNTKFCYYNNYSLSQPRYFCKTCRRYWTEGGSLRNVPIGGGSRKNKRSPPSPSPSSSPNTTSLSSLNYTNSNLSSCCPPQTYAPVPHHHQHQIIMNPSKIMMIHAAGQDLNLAYPPPPPTSCSENHDNAPHHIPNPTTLSAMELLKINSFPEPGCGGGGLYSAAGFSRGEYKPALNFSVEGFENGSGGYGRERGVEESSATGGGCRLLFPFEGLKQQEGVSSEGDEIANTTNTSAVGYWNGMSGTEGGSW